MSWLASFFRAPRRTPVEEGVGTPVDESIDESILALGDGLQKVARALARQGMQIEEIETKVEGGFSDLRAALKQTAVSASPRPIEWNDLLDAADALDEAERSAAAAGDAAMAEGLRAVGARVGRFFAQLGVRRERSVGVAPDPAFVRVVGTVEAATTSDGNVARVVRAAVIEGGRLLREGEVLVARRPTSSKDPSEVSP